MAGARQRTLAARLICNPGGKCGKNKLIRAVIPNPVTRTEYQASRFKSRVVSRMVSHRPMAKLAVSSRLGNWSW